MTDTDALIADLTARLERLEALAPPVLDAPDPEPDLPGFTVLHSMTVNGAGVRCEWDGEDIPHNHTVHIVTRTETGETFHICGLCSPPDRRTT